MAVLKSQDLDVGIADRLYKTTPVTLSLAGLPFLHTCCSPAGYMLSDYATQHHVAYPGKPSKERYCT